MSPRMIQRLARLLLPLKTNCWVCNMVRGFLLGLAVGGSVVASLAIGVFRWVH